VVVPSTPPLLGVLQRPVAAQYLSIRYTGRLAEAGAVTSVGSRGDSYDNALAETIIGLYKTELVRRRGPWRDIDDVEYATLEWVDWFNHRRLLEPIGYVPPAEFEAAFQRQSQMSLVGRPCRAENRDGRPPTSLVLGAAEPARQSDAGSRVKGPALSLRARESGFPFALMASRAAFSFPFPTREETRWRRPTRQWN
jgi:Integrase core domain